MRPLAKTTSAAPAPLDATGDRQAKKNGGALVTLIHIFFLVLMLEGVLRKWVFPDLNTVVAFVHLPILMFIYLLAVFSGRWPKGPDIFRASMAFSVVVVVVAVVQAMSGGLVAIELAVSAWIGYFFFIPLAYIVAATFEKTDIANFSLLCLASSAINAFLMFLQKDAPADDVINQGSGVGSDQIFSGLSLVDELIRPMGVFTSPLANTVYISLVACFWWFLVISRTRYPVPVLLFPVGALVTCMSIAMSGSRMVVFLMLAVAMVTFFVLRRVKHAIVSAQPLAITALLVLAGLAASGNVLESGVGSLTSRFEAAWTDEEEAYDYGTLGRLFLLNDIQEMAANVSQTPLLGYGLGTGSNAAYITGYISDDLYRESSWAKHMNDLGLPLALIYIGLRFMFLWTALSPAWRLLRHYGDGGPLVMTSVVGIFMAIGQTVSNVAAGPFVWLFFGLMLACLRLAEAEWDGSTPSPQESRR